MAIGSSRSSARTTLAGTTIVALLLGAAIAPSAIAEPTLEGPQVVQFAQEPDHAVTDGELFILQGTPVPGGGCEFEYSLTLAEEEQAIALHELARDPASCESLIERGTPTAPPRVGPYDDASLLSIPGTGSSDQLAPAATVTKSVTGYVYHEDPAGINVTELWDKLTWNPNRRCANAGPASGEVTDDWYEPSGWSRFVRQSSGDANCKRVKLVTNAIYENQAFCNPSVSTFVRYRPNRVKGFARGKGARHSWTQRTDGDCAFLLSFHHEFYRN